MVRETVEQGGGHLESPKNGRTFADSEIDRTVVEVRLKTRPMGAA
jgi:hypothetical protein